MRSSIWLTAAAVALMAGSTAFATPRPDIAPRAAQAVADQTTGATRSAPDRPGSAGERQAAPPAQKGSPTAVPGLDGKDVVDVEGDRVGSVAGAVGDALIVSVGGFLGLGQRQVAVPVDRLALSRTGDEVKVVTNLTKDQLKALPDYREGAGSRAPDTAPGRD
ncbi:MAG: PRC-barrel domain-containing protein [Rhodospirillaceae bacterium]